MNRPQQRVIPPLCAEYGRMLLWRGGLYPLLGDSADNRIWRDARGFHLPPDLDAALLKYNVIRLYKLCARNYLQTRVRHFSAQMGVSPSALRVTDAKKRWGSCSERLPPGAQKRPPSVGRAPGSAAVDAPVYRVNFSWRLCLAPDDVIDAVVVHELAHIKQMNHSPAFYAAVRAVLPDYDARNARLKQLSALLRYDD